MNDTKSSARKPAPVRSQSQSVDAARIGHESDGSSDASLGAPQPVVPELEPVTVSEVRTKLDLARMFLDMGDPASARHMLDEVLNEGDSVQKQEAQRLLDLMP
jgi:FimV-like protein